MDGLALNWGVSGCIWSMEACRSLIRSSMLDVSEGFRPSDREGLDRPLDGTLDSWLYDEMADDMDAVGV